MAGCGDSSPPAERVLLVTTTTVEGSGLLDTLLTAYHADHPERRVLATAVGSGAALEIGRRGDADLLLTHDPVGEARLREEGLSAEQGPVMANQFVIAGPAGDPAGVAGMTDLATALGRIAGTATPFISRGDRSGTHSRELQLWEEAGLAPWESQATWYVESGSGMAEALRIASVRGAYLLTDTGTLRHLQDRLDLAVLVRGEPPVENPYTYTLPRDPTNPQGARHLLEWLLSDGQRILASYGATDRQGPLFRPTAAPR